MMKHSAIVSPKANAVDNSCLVTVVLRAGNGLSRLSWTTGIKPTKCKKKIEVVFVSSYSHPLVTVPTPPTSSVGRGWLREGDVREQKVEERRRRMLQLFHLIPIFRCGPLRASHAHPCR